MRECALNGRPNQSAGNTRRRVVDMTSLGGRPGRRGPVVTGMSVAYGRFRLLERFPIEPRVGRVLSSTNSSVISLDRVLGRVPSC